MPLPTTFNPNEPKPDGSEAVATGPAQISANQNALASFLGIPTSPTQLTAPAFSMTAGGVVTIQQPGALLTADPTVPLGIASKQYVDSNTSFHCPVTGANSYTGTLIPTATSLTQIQWRPLLIQPQQTNTGAVTLNLSSFGAIALLDNHGSALQAGRFVTGITYTVIYDGANFILQNPATPTRFSGTATGPNSYNVTFTPTIGSMAEVTGYPLVIGISGTNSGSPTFNLNNLGPFGVVDTNGASLGANMLRDQVNYTFIFDGSHFLLQGALAQPFPGGGGGCVFLGNASGLVQGVVVSVGAGATTAFPWPITFPNACWSAVAVPQSAITGAYNVTGFNTANFTIHNGAAGTTSYNVMGIGY